MARIDADEIYPLLWQGGRPLEGMAVANAGFNAVVFCAAEYQPPPERFPGLDAVMYVPLHDHGPPPTKGELESALQASYFVSNWVAQGRKVLVTCSMGLNRSGLVVALASMALVPRASCIEVIDRIRDKRAMALRNEWFTDFICRVDKKRRRYQRRSRMPQRARAGRP